MARKTERKGNTIKCPEKSCVQLTNLWSCFHVCCSARSSTGVALWIKQAKNGGICNVSVCCLGGGGEILMENSRRGVRNALWNLTSFQAKMCVFPNPISDLKKHTQCKSDPKSWNFYELMIRRDYMQPCEARENCCKLFQSWFCNCFWLVG